MPVGGAQAAACQAAGSRAGVVQRGARQSGKPGDEGRMIAQRRQMSVMRQHRQRQ